MEHDLSGSGNPWTETSFVHHSVSDSMDWIFLYSSEVSFFEYLPYFPVGVIGGYTALVVLAILGAYVLGGRRLLKEPVMEAIKDDTI